jgi:probable F420-dependent oxidoreductase
MRIGAIFPQTEIRADPTDIRRYVTAVDDLGYDHIGIYDHVLGADVSSRPSWRGPYTSESLFHEVFVTFGYMAALSNRLELVTSILILPQRQTALVAKQAAEVDVLTGGRFRLGVGLGWNDVEYAGLGTSFLDRSSRISEQIEVLRQLWTEPAVTFHGRYHTIEAAGILPLPVQRPIPIWMGGLADSALKRIARLADGWFPQLAPFGEGRAKVMQFREYLAAAERDPQKVGLEGRIQFHDGDPDRWRREIEAWRSLDATHVSIVTTNAGFRSLDDHLRAVTDFRQVCEAAQMA